MPDLLSVDIPRTCHNVTERGEIVAAHHHVLLPGRCKHRVAMAACGPVIAPFPGPHPTSSVTPVSVLIKAFSAVLDQHDQEWAASHRRRFGGGAGFAAPYRVVSRRRVSPCRPASIRGLSIAFRHSPQTGAECGKPTQAVLNSR